MANDYITSTYGIKEGTAGWRFQSSDASTLVNPVYSSPNSTHGNSTPAAVTLSTAATVVTVGGHTSELSYIGIGSVCFEDVGIIGTCIVIIAHKPLRSKLSNYFLVNQSFVDLLVGLVMLIVNTSTFDTLLTRVGIAAQMAHCIL